MKKAIVAGFLACWVGFAAPALAGEAEKFKQSVPDELGDAWERLQQVVQDWGSRLKERFGGVDSPESRPAISQMLSYREYLALSPEQVKKLEQLRDNFQRQSIRNEADTRIVELDIAQLLDSPNVDMGKVEGKIREAEKLRGDLRIARLRTIEQAKAVLNAEQRKKFSEASEARPARPPRASQNPPAREREPLSP
jgi:Spy/CpxP family protein refolding chaperone